MSGQMDMSDFPSIKATSSSWPTAVLYGVNLTEGKWYYECKLESVADDPQLGWADSAFSVSKGNGVGDDAHSWGVDGNVDLPMLLRLRFCQSFP